MIDHIFMLIDPEGPEIGQMERLGLAETYRRTHPGQGTRNICYCFDNMFFELLWFDDPVAARSPAIQRTGLFERSMWRSREVCPFGIAWRGTSPWAEASIPTWLFAPPYLSDGMTIAVAEDGDDVRQPMMFRSLSSAPPIDWPPEKRGKLQHGSGLGAVQEIIFTMPASATPSGTLKAIAANCQPRLTLTHGDAWHLAMWINGLDGRPDLLVATPE